MISGGYVPGEGIQGGRLAQAALVCPTRARPGSAWRLIGAWGRLGVCSDLIFCVDDDDPCLGTYRDMMSARTFHRGVVIWVTGPRKPMAEWTNWVAGTYLDAYDGFLSLGDDHVPETAAFDRALLDAADGCPGGMAYGDDGLQHANLPTACLMLSDTIRALGWEQDGKPAMCLPGCRHMFIDAAWKHLGQLAGIAYQPQVSMRHLHHTARLSRPDQTYADGEASWPADEAVFRAWTGVPAGEVTQPAADSACAADAQRILSYSRAAPS